jgi:hypothetical protein
MPPARSDHDNELGLPIDLGSTTRYLDIPVGPVIALGSLAKRSGWSGVSKPASRACMKKLIPAPRTFDGRGTGASNAPSASLGAYFGIEISCRSASHRSASIGSAGTSPPVAVSTST